MSKSSFAPNRSLTYMSTRDVIRECVDAGELYRIVPRRNGSSVMRELFATPAVSRFLNGETDIARRALIKRAADTRAAVDRFVSGAEISVGMDPFEKAAHAELARNDPPGDGIWDFRIRDPKPHVRLFGGFAERDVFVALDYRNRETVIFDDAVVTMGLLWKDLFGERPPVTGDEINAYLSDKYTPV